MAQRSKRYITPQEIITLLRPGPGDVLHISVPKVTPDVLDHYAEVRTQLPEGVGLLVTEQTTVEVLDEPVSIT